MKTVSVTEAQAQFSKLLERVMAGEKIGIMIRGREVARLVPITLEGVGHSGDSRGSCGSKRFRRSPAQVAAGRLRGQAPRKSLEE